MQFPSFYKAERIGTLFYPDVASISSDAQAAQLKPSDADVHKTLLLLVDMQIDFCHEHGTLYVPGAKDDIRRVIELIYTFADKITTIMSSLDSHNPLQIFHPAWWENKAGEHPAPFTLITPEAVDAGQWIPRFQSDWSRRYVHELQRTAKKQLIIWPYHVPIGGMGNALDPELWSAVFWHSIARQSQPMWLHKGSLAETEHYSIVRPEIGTNEGEQSAAPLMRTLVQEYDRILIAGEAESHCVLETVKDLTTMFGEEPEALSKIIVLQDCMSPVQHPDIDFHALALEEFQKCALTGMQFRNSTENLFD